MKNKLTIIIALFIIITGICVVLIYNNSSNNKDGEKVEVITAPNDAIVFIDNKKSDNVSYLKPGEHNLRVLRNNFNTYETKFMVKKDSPLVLPVGLTPSNDSGKKWVLDNPEDYQKIEGISSKILTDNSELMQKKYPITIELPVDMTPNYRIDYGLSKKYPSDSTKIALYISANDSRFRQTALYAIYTMGYDPSDYEIIFQPIDIESL